AQRRTERNARIAVTIFPLLVIAGGVIGFVGSDSISTLASTIPWGLGVIMFFMGVTLTLPDFTRIAKRPWVVALGTGSQFIVMPLAGWAIAQLLGLPPALDRKSTRLNSSHVKISYAVFCLKQKTGLRLCRLQYAT